MAEKKQKEKKEQEKELLQYSIGRRKRAIAKVRMLSGDGEVTINNKPSKKFFYTESDEKEFLKILSDVDMLKGHSFTVKVMGGGYKGQTEAIRHAIARCLSKVNEDLKKSMKTKGYLTRDPREKERKKIYHIGARKSPQFSKR